MTTETTAPKKPARAARTKTTKTTKAAKTAKAAAAETPEIKQTEMFPEASPETPAAPEPAQTPEAVSSEIPVVRVIPGDPAEKQTPADTPAETAPPAKTVARTALSVVLGGAAVVLFAANAALLTVVYQERAAGQNLATVSVTEVLEDTEKKLLAENLSGEALQKAARAVSERLEARLSELREQCSCTLLTRSAVVKAGSLPDYTGELKAAVGADVASHLAQNKEPASPLEPAAPVPETKKPARPLTPTAAQRLMPEA
jgi:hypothetical protein